MILIVDDEKENRESLAAILSREGHICLLAADADEALELLRERNEIKLLITDLKMPGSMNGLMLLESARHIRPDVERVLVTAFGTIEDTVSAMKAGAFTVIPKPLKAKNIREVVAKLLAKTADLARVAPTPIGQLSRPYAELTENLRRGAASDLNILFTGEVGSGKSFFAKILHEWSMRREAPFQAIKCATLKDLKPVFTLRTGSLVLEEVSDLSYELQTSLLDLLDDQSREKYNVRILATTNKNLSDLVSKGIFRSDLYFRLRVMEIRVPPLRERRQDLLWMVPSIIEHITEKHNKPYVRLSETVWQKLWLYDFPGNIRELENLLESALVLARNEDLDKGLLTQIALPTNPHTKADIPIVDLATLEKTAIKEALILTGGNKKLAASILGISERTLYRALD